MQNPTGHDAGFCCRWLGIHGHGQGGVRGYRNIDLEVSTTNLFDRNYELSSRFPEPGRVGLVQLRYRY